MRENIITVVALLALALLGWTEEKRIKPLKKEIVTLQFEVADAQKEAKKAEALEREVTKLQEEVRETAAMGLAFKKELEETRFNLAKAEFENEGQTPRPYGEPKEEHDTDYDTSIGAGPATPAKPDNSAKMKVLVANLEKGQALIESIEQERGNFREYTDRASYGRQAGGAGRGGIRTSDADRQRWEADRDARLAKARAYVRSVQDAINALQ